MKLICNFNFISHFINIFECILEEKIYIYLQKRKKMMTKKYFLSNIHLVILFKLYKNEYFLYHY